MKISFIEEWDDNIDENEKEVMIKIYVYKVDNNIAHMMAIVMNDGTAYSFNMDGGKYFNNNEEPYIEIPEDVLEELMILSESRIMKAYRKYED